MSLPLATLYRRLDSVSRGRARASLFALLIGCAMLAFAADAALAQSGVVTGRVTDAEGRPVYGASVYVADTGFGAVTDALGRYRLGGLPAGSAPWAQSSRERARVGQ